MDSVSVEELGHDEVYVRPFREWDKNRTQISASGGRSPVWSADGRELFFLNGDAMMVVPVSTSGDFTAATPKLLFKGTYVEGPGGARNYDVAPDARRFLMIKEIGHIAEPPPRDRLVVVLNWADEVRQALAMGK